MLAAIGAHPDDAEIGAGGLLARVGGVVIALTSGANHTRSQEVATTESQAAAKFLGCESVLFEIPELYFVNQDLVALLDRVFKEYEITEVVTHPPTDTNQEHANTAQAVLAASRRIDRVMFWEPMPPAGRFRFQPHIYADISGVAEKKYRAMNCYKTQMFRQGRNLITTRKALDAWRGNELGVDSAECFEVARWTI